MLTLNNFQLKTATLEIDYFQKRRPPLDREGPPAITGKHKKWQRGIVSFCRPHVPISSFLRPLYAGLTPQRSICN
jgi:hypothetical protein